MIRILNDLKTFGISENYFGIKRIGNFKNAKKEGYDHINTQAIDFDETKIKVCNELNQHQCMSCDALDIIDSKDRINLIEFKKLEDNKTIEDWIKGLDLPQKIKDSRDVLFSIVRNKKFIYKNKTKKFTSCEKNVIISFSLVNGGVNKLATLMRWTTVKGTIEKQFYNNYIQGEKFNEPICIRTHEFDARYISFT